MHFPIMMAIVVIFVVAEYIETNPNNRKNETMEFVRSNPVLFITMFFILFTTVSGLFGLFILYTYTRIFIADKN